ncbi:MAG: EI24 domain-containing protein [Deltaproteobacteria bacterium]|nr:EI24 domain-containing protein [Deltaproteobacteria bacterium]
MFAEKNSRLRKWLPLSFSLRFLFGNFRILLWSLALILVTALLTWAGYLLTVDLVNGLLGDFFQQAPDRAGIIGWFQLQGWQLLKILFLLISRVIAFYLAFLLAYTLTAPGYAFLSNAVEKRYLGDKFSDDIFTWSVVLQDLLEGCKIAFFGVLVTVAAIFLNFLPLLGSVLVVFLYIFYSTLMLIDYPASRRHLSLGEKLGWLKKHWFKALRLGWMPALISMIPVVNIFLLALFFPLFAVHATLNYVITVNPERE